jgi:hypothetical protein
MNEYDERFTLMRRQIEGLQGAIKFYQERRDIDAKLISQLQSTVSELTTQMQIITQSVAILKARTMGHGSTVGV